MQEKLKAFGTKLKERLKKISKKVIVIAAVAVVVLVALIVVVRLSRPYSVLFTGMSAGETSSVLAYLDSAGVTDYKVQNNDTILVPKSQVERLKVRLLMEGYPQTGYAYSTYDSRISSLSTESERENAYQMFLQESLSNTIRTFDNVKDATVYITPGEDRGYVLETGNVVKASASVQVTMEGTAKLSSREAAAIRNLVARAVQGLEVGSVSITDTMGNDYSADAAAAAGDASALKLQLEEEYENKVRTEVLKALVPFFGEDHVKVGVNCSVEVSQKTVNSRDVYLPDWAADGSTDGKGIPGSLIYEYYVNRDGDDTVGGLVGSETNSDIPEQVEREADPNGTEQALGGSGQVDYDNPFEETQALYTAGYLTDCTVAVSIDSTTAGAVNVDAFRAHVARAAGIAGVFDEVTGEEFLEDKISVIAEPFYHPPDVEVPVEPVIPMWVLVAAAAGLLLFVLLLIIILLLRRRSRKRKQAEKQQELDAMLAAVGIADDQIPVTADVMTMQTEKSMELRKDIRQFANDNPEIAAQMVRSWLRGDDTNE